MACTSESFLLCEQLDDTAEKFGDNPGIIHAGTRLTWAQVGEQSRWLAKALLAHGVTRGDNVALWFPNHPGWLVMWLAAVRIGAAVVPINTQYKPAEAAYILAKSEAKALIMEDSFLGKDFVESFREMCPDWNGRNTTQLPDLNTVILLGRNAEGTIPYADFLASSNSVSDAELEIAAARAEPEDTIIIVFTSGTTGNPKGVMHSHNALRMMRSVVQTLGIGPEDRILGHLPLFHVSGVFSSFLPALITGGALVQMDRWDPAVALQVIADEGISVLSGIPTHFIDLLRHPDVRNFDTSSLRTGWIGGSTIPAEVIAGARETLGMSALLPVYGMTETTSTTTLGRPSDSVESLLAAKGVPLGGYEVRVVDPHSREPLPTGAEGEVSVRGYTVMKGYYRDEEATAAVLDPDGWFYTGDLGVFDSNGYLSITGRLSDKFIVGGFNVHPADIEHVLAAHPQVKQAHVVSRPDERLGEVAVAFVETVPGADLDAEEITEYCRGRLASFKVPRSFIFVDAWPTTPSGKIQRFKLRETALSTHSLERKSHVQ